MHVTLCPMFRWTCIFSFILLWQLRCVAQDNSCTERTLIVTARSASGSKALPYTLQLSDLRGKVNGKPMQILAATKPAAPTRVVLVLDASGSMSAKWQRAVEFAGRIVQQSPEPTKFAMLIFAENERRRVDFGKTRPDFVTEVTSFQDVKPHGHTALRNAIWDAISMFQPGGEGDTIVVVSDGVDDHSNVPLRRLQEAMWARGIRIIFVQLLDHYFAIQSEGGEDMDAYWLSQSSGGFLFRVDSPQVLPNIAREIVWEIENYLAVRITLPAVLKKDASVHLEAVDSSGHKRKNIELAFPEKLLSCPELSSGH